MTMTGGGARLTVRSFDGDFSVFINAGGAVYKSEVARTFPETFLNLNLK